MHALLTELMNQSPVMGQVGYVCECVLRDKESFVNI